MNYAVASPAWVPPALWYWPLILAIPIVLAAGRGQKSTITPSLPDESSYRSSQSDMAIESSSWRSEGADYESWREPPPPASGSWRSKSSRPSNSAAGQRQAEYFPKYEPGNPAFYNHQTREQEDQIKVFEFGR